MKDIRNDLRILNKITDIVKKKKFKMFCYVIYKNDASYVNRSYKNDFTNIKTMVLPNKNPNYC